MLSPKSPDRVINSINALTESTLEFRGTIFSLQNTVIPEFQPDLPWRATVADALKGAKENGGEWLRKGNAELLVAITQPLIEYSNTFEAFVKLFESNVASGRDAAARRAAMAGLTNLKQRVDTAQKQLKAAVNAQKAMGDELTKLRKSVVSARREAVKKHQLEAGTLQSLRAELNALEADRKSAEDRFKESTPTTNLGAAGSLFKNIAWSSGGTMAVNMAGIFVKAKQVSLGVITSAKLIKGVPVAVAIASALLIYTQFKVNSLHQEYTAKLSECLKKIREISTVAQALIISEMVDKSLEDIQSNIKSPHKIGEDLANMWAAEGEKIDAALNMLGETDDLSKLPAFKHLGTAAAVWARVAREASLLQSKMVNEVRPIAEKLDLSAPLKIVGGVSA